MEDILEVSEKVARLSKAGIIGEASQVKYRDNEEGEVPYVTLPTDQGKKIIVATAALSLDPNLLKPLIEKARSLLEHTEALRVSVLPTAELLVTLHESRGFDTHVAINLDEQVTRPSVTIMGHGAQGVPHPLTVSLMAKTLPDAVQEVLELQKNPYTYEPKKTKIDSHGDVVELMLDAWKPGSGAMPIVLKGSSRQASLVYNPDGANLSEQFLLHAGWNEAQITDSKVVPNPLYMLEKTIQLIIKEADRISKITLLDTKYTVGGSAFVIEEL